MHFFIARDLIFINFSQCQHFLFKLKCSIFSFHFLQSRVQKHYLTFYSNFPTVIVLRVLRVEVRVVELQVRFVVVEVREGGVRVLAVAAVRRWKRRKYNALYWLKKM